jgi:mono/diheme cytochrome c family protein
VKKVLIGLYLIIIVGIFVLLLSNNYQQKKNKVVSAGAEVYQRQCTSCHGKLGKGEGANVGTALNNQHFLSSVTDEDLKKYISYGRSGTEMPGYKSFSDKDLDNLVAFIRNWQTEEIKMSAPKVISGNIENGVRLYKLYCLTCHGENAAGMQKMGPSLSSPEYLKYTSDKQLWITTAYGREGTRMGPSLKGLDGVKQLKEQEITDIVSYIRSLAKKQ